MHRVFVYGTRYQGEFTTLETCPLYIVGDRYSPWRTLDLTKGHSIKGQVFSVLTAAIMYHKII